MVFYNFPIKKAARLRQCLKVELSYSIPELGGGVGVGGTEQNSYSVLYPPPHSILFSTNKQHYSILFYYSIQITFCQQIKTMF